MMQALTNFSLTPLDVISSSLRGLLIITTIWNKMLDCKNSRGYPKKLYLDGYESNKLPKELEVLLLWN